MLSIIETVHRHGARGIIAGRHDTTMHTPHDAPDIAWVRQLPDGRALTLRRLTPSDVEVARAFFDNLSYGDCYYRFGRAGFRLSEAEIQGLCRSDPRVSRHDIVLAGAGDDIRVIANADCTLAPDGAACEFGILVAEGWRGRGIARWLMERMAENARVLGASRLVAEAMTSNRRMLGFARRLGFQAVADAERPALTWLELRLD